MISLSNETDWIGKDSDPITGFSFKHGVRGDTQGVLMWPDAFLYDSEDEKIAIVIMDTQGLFEPGKTQQENARIFSLSNLISSVQIYNLKETIKENELEYLEMACEFTKFIAEGASSEKQVDKRIRMFQSLIFLIRDFNDDDFKYGFEGGRKLLDEVLNLPNEKSNEVVQKVRANVRSSFENLDCHLMPHPGDAVRSKMFDGRWKELKTEFIEHLREIIESVLSPQKLIKKKIYGKDVTGESFSSYLKSYFEMFNSSELPDIKNVFETTSKIQIQNIMDSLFKSFCDEIDQINNSDEEEPIVCDFSESTVMSAKYLAEFDATSKMGSDLMIANCRQEFIEKLLVKFHSYFLAKLKNNLNQHRMTISTMRANEEERVGKLEKESAEVRIKAVDAVSKVEKEKSKIELEKADAMAKLEIVSTEKENMEKLHSSEVAKLSTEAELEKNLVERSALEKLHEKVVENEVKKIELVAASGEKEILMQKLSEEKAKVEREAHEKQLSIEREREMMKEEAKMKEQKFEAEAQLKLKDFEIKKINEEKTRVEIESQEKQGAMEREREMLLHKADAEKQRLAFEAAKQQEDHNRKLFEEKQKLADKERDMMNQLKLEKSLFELSSKFQDAQIDQLKHEAIAIANQPECILM